MSTTVPKPCEMPEHLRKDFDKVLPQKLVCKRCHQPFVVDTVEHLGRAESGSTRIGWAYHSACGDYNIYFSDYETPAWSGVSNEAFRALRPLTDFYPHHRIPIEAKRPHIIDTIGTIIVATLLTMIMVMLFIGVFVETFIWIVG